MNGLARIFMLAAILSALLGMVWGIQMAATHDHLLSPAHGHLNLLGWVSLALYALYYHAVPGAAGSTIARAHLWVALIGVAVLVPGIALAILEVTEGLAIAGSFIVLASMLVFALVVWRS